MRGELDEHGCCVYDKDHLARMIALLGPPPADLIERGGVSEWYFGEEGKFLYESGIRPSL